MGALVAAFGIDWQLLLAQGVNFIVVLVVLTYFVYGPVMRSLKDRAAAIKRGIEDAAAAARDRETVKGERGAIISEAQHEAEMILARAEDEGKNERAEIVKNAQDRAASVLKDAQLEAAETMQKAMKAGEAEMARTAVLAAEKILRTHQ